MKKRVITKASMRTPTILFVALVAVTVGLAVGLPPDPHAVQQLNTTESAYRLAILVLLVPYGIIWYTAFYAFTRLVKYAHATKGYPDGEAFRKIMIGMGVLAYGLVLPTAVTLILRNIAVYHPDFKPAAVIISHYLTILVVLVTFAFIGNGTRQLANAVKRRPKLGGMRVFALLFIVLSAIFTYLVTSYNAERPNVYYLDTPWLIITFVIPYLFGWFMALLSAYEFGIYAKYAKGLLYQRALQLLSYGIITTIAGSVAIQFLSNTFVATAASQSIGYILVVDYILLAIIGLGLGMMAFGAKKLQKFEEV
jgi:hypothetical protein